MFPVLSHCTRHLSCFSMKLSGHTTIHFDECCHWGIHRPLGRRKILFSFLGFLQFLSVPPLSIFFSLEKSPLPPSLGRPLLSLSRPLLFCSLHSTFFFFLFISDVFSFEKAQEDFYYQDDCQEQVQEKWQLSKCSGHQNLWVFSLKGH